MKLKSFLLALLASLLVCITISAQTIIQGGLVSGNWPISGSPYNIQGSIQIPSNSVLTIDPGVIINFQGAFKLLVSGTLIAVGNAQDTIRFTSSNSSTGWRGIRFDGTAASSDSSRIKFCSVTNGRATGSGSDAYGGAIYVADYSKLILANCFISNNSAPSIYGGYGGGVYCVNSSPIISCNKFYNNSAYYGGGAIYCYNSNPLIEKNIIINNSVQFITPASYYGGGGIHCYYNSSAIISNNVICNNVSSNSGGGIYIRNSAPTIINCTIANNSSNGSANNGGGGIIFTESANPIVKNSIIYGNNSTSNGNNVYLDDENSDPNFSYCNIGGGLSSFGLNGSIFTGNYTNNIDSNPLFILPTAGPGSNFNASNANWQLQNNSPSINAGSPIGNYPSLDLQGNTRVVSCTIDQGAYENQNSTSPAPPPTISASGSTLFCQGGSVVLNASEGTGLSFQWQRNGVNISGATSASYIATSAGSFAVIVTNSNGCSAASNSITVTIPLPAVSISGLANFTNINSNPISIASSPTGGSFTGSGMNGHVFYPQSAGLGSKTITYSYTDNNGCSNTASQSTIVYDTLGTVCASYDTVVTNVFDTTLVIQTIYDTLQVTIYDTLLTTVTDTLVINSVITGINPPNNQNTLKVFPNPVNTHITIDYGNFSSMGGYTLKIVNAIGQTVFTSPINQQTSYINLSTWTGSGIYYVQLIDPQNNIIENRKIVIQ